MEITLYVTNSERNKLNKVLGTAVTLDGKLRDASNIINPVILIQMENPTTYNYVHISAFNRYYFINEFKSVRTGLWEISLKVDPLMSFKSAISGLVIVVSDTQQTQLNRYVHGEQWIANCKHKTDIITFPSGLPNNGQFILITAGG